MVLSIAESPPELPEHPVVSPKSEISRKMSGKTRIRQGGSSPNRVGNFGPIFRFLASTDPRILRAGDNFCPEVRRPVSYLSHESCQQFPVVFSSVNMVYNQNPQEFPLLEASNSRRCSMVSTWWHNKNPL